MTRLWNGLLLGLACWRVGALAAQDSVPASAATYATLMRANYRSLETVRQGRAAMPSKLIRKVTLARRSVLLQQALLDIANQAGLGLSYGEDLARSKTVISIDVAEVRAADALAAAVRGTSWTVFVNPASQVTVVKAIRSAGGSITGWVTDRTTGEGLRDSEVFLEEARLRTRTDTAGRYRLAEVDPGAYTLTVRRLGYKKRSERVTVRADAEDTVNLALEPVAVPLNELVTTATGAQRRRDIGNAVTTIRADSVLEHAPVRNLTDLLNGRVPGLTVQHTTGAPGDPAKLRLRGLRSVLRSNDPVVIVDGMRIYATQSEARSGNLTNILGSDLSGSKTINASNASVRSAGVPAPSPLDQIDPNTIEKIEVFKGPSATTQYGADAANGVIVVTTKRGRPGPTVWDVSVIQGRKTQPGRYPLGYYRWGHDALTGFPRFCTLVDLTCVADSLTRFQALNDPELTVLGTGHNTQLSVTAAGGTQALTYRITGTYGSEVGVLRLPAFEVTRFDSVFHRSAPDWMQRPQRYESWSVSNAMTARLSRTANVQLMATLSRYDQQRSSLENQLPSLMGTYLDRVSGQYYRPDNSARWSSGAYVLEQTSAMLSEYYVRTTASGLRFTTGANASWLPTSWFTMNGNASLDALPRDDQLLRPAGLVSLSDSGTLVRGTGRALVGNFGLQGELRKPFGHGFAFTTSFGANLTTTSTNDLYSRADKLLPGITSISGARQITAGDQRVNTSVFGWYIEPRVAGQRLSLSTGLRLDGGSAYGARVTRTGGGGGLSNLLALPKLNGSWVISEEPFFPAVLQQLFSSLRLRGAYGQSQVQPGPADRLRIYNRTTDGTATLFVSSVGNPEIRPERSREFEGGFDADLFDSRLSVEFTAHLNDQLDALMPVTIPVSVNGGGQIIRNIGDIRNSGLELVVGGAPLRRSGLTWAAQLHFSRNRNTLLRLGRGVEPNKNAGLVAGYPIYSRWALPILGFSDKNGDGILQRSEVQVGDSLVYMGRLQPDYQMAWNSNLVLFNGALGITTDFTYDAGMTQVDQTSVANWVLERGLVDPASPFSEQASVLAFNRDNTFSPSTDYGVMQSVSTLRFQSLSVNYRAPQRWARLLGANQLRVAVQGQNLGVHSTYRGKDPDVNAWSPGEGIIDIGQLPQSRTWQLRVDLQY